MDEIELDGWIGGGTDRTVHRGPECPEDDDLAAFVDDRLPEEAGSRLRNHLADCDHCLQAVGFLSRCREVEPAGVVPASLEAAARQKRFARASAPRVQSLRRWVAAAALVLMTSVTIWKLDSGAVPVGDRVVRDSTGLTGDAGPGPQVVFPPGGETISAAGVDFRWTGVATAVSYEIRVVTLDGDVVWEQRVFGTETTLPAEVPLVPGEPYLVRISAQLTGGKTLESEHVRFFVRNP